MSREGPAPGPLPSRVPPHPAEEAICSRFLSGFPQGARLGGRDVEMNPAPLPPHPSRPARGAGGRRAQLPPCWADSAPPSANRASRRTGQRAPSSCWQLREAGKWPGTRRRGGWRGGAPVPAVGPSLLLLRSPQHQLVFRLPCDPFLAPPPKFKTNQLGSFHGLWGGQAL